MKILLDTNALVWWFVGDSRLSARALAAMDEAVEVYYSMVSLWEVGLKLGKGGYDFSMPADWEVALPALAGKFDMKETTIVARASSGEGSNNPACSGAALVRRTSWACAASSKARTSKPPGKPAARS